MGLIYEIKKAQKYQPAQVGNFVHILYTVDSGLIYKIRRQKYLFYVSTHTITHYAMLLN